MSAATRFLDGSGVDGAGRSHAEVLALGDRELEARHDFIQWLFPLAEASAAVPGSPVLSAEDVEAIRGSPAAQAALRAGAERMLAFYRATDHWLVPFDHNHLRITRIVRSLRLLVGDAEADAFRAAVLERVRETGGPINARSLGYWAEA
jgi:hypothetical protein